MAMNTKVRNEEVGVVLKRFGDEQSTLLDKFERLSFEVRLNQAILGRSLSEPGEVSGSRFQVPMIGQAPEPEVKQGRRNGKMGFQRILKKLLRPILGRKVTKHKDSAPKMEAPDPRDLKSWKAFSRSLRI